MHNAKVLFIIFQILTNQQGHKFRKGKITFKYKNWTQKKIFLRENTFTCLRRPLSYEQFCINNYFVSLDNINFRYSTEFEKP